MRAFHPSLPGRLAAAAMLSLLTATAHAVPVAYDDRLPGQDFLLNRDGLPLTLFNFDAGQNIVRGRETSRQRPFAIDVDGFRFQLGADLRLDSIVLTYSFVGVPTPDIPNPNRYCNQWQLRNASRAALDTQTPDPLGTCGSFVDLQGNPLYGPTAEPGDSVFSAALPLSNGIFELVAIGGQFGPGGGELDYTFTFNVTNTSNPPPPAGVPEPATATLLALGLGGLVSLRRRQRAI